MDSNRCSHGYQGQPRDPVAALAANLDALDAEDLDELADMALTERAQDLRQHLGRLEGQWLKTLATLDARGVAGADHGTRAASTASWLRHRLRMGHAAAHQRRADRPGVVPGSVGRHRPGLCAGELSAAHASALAHGTRELPAQVVAEAEPTLVAAAAGGPGAPGPPPQRRR